MTDEAISPLRRRMIEDMTIRKLAQLRRLARREAAKSLIFRADLERSSLHRGRGIDGHGGNFWWRLSG
jgi:hypothetical protein